MGISLHWKTQTRQLGFAVLTWILVSTVGHGRADEIPLGSDGGVYTVPVVVNRSVKIPFIVDSGAAPVVIPEDVLRILVRGGTVSQSDILGTTMVTLADGSTQRRMRLRLRELRVGSHIAENVIATVTPQNGDPLLGQTFLSRFGTVSFDYRRRVLVLSGPEGAPVTAVMPQPVSPTERARGNCYTQSAIEAEQALRFLTDVMIVSSTCHDTIYAEFRLRNRDPILAYQKAMIAHFQGTPGFDRWNTFLANQAAQKHAGQPSTIMCQQATELMKQASALDPPRFRAFAAAQAAAAAPSYPLCGR